MPATKPPKTKSKKALLIHFPADLADELKAFAKTSDLNQSQVVRKAVKHLIKQRP